MPNVEAGELRGGDEGGGDGIDEEQGVAEPHVGRRPQGRWCTAGPFKKRSGKEGSPGHGEHPQEGRAKAEERPPADAQARNQRLHVPIPFHRSPDERYHRHHQGKEHHRGVREDRNQRLANLTQRQGEQAQHRRPSEHRPPQAEPGQAHEEDEREQKARPD